MSLMNRYGSSEIEVRVLSYEQAKTHWQVVREKYASMAARFLDDVKSIEDERIRWTVGAIIEALAAEDNCGSFIVRHDDQLGFEVQRIELEPEVLDKLFSISSDDEIQKAYAWLLDHVQDVPMTWVRWAIGRLELEPPVKGVRGVFDHVVYDFDLQAVVGVSTHSHRCERGRIVKVEL